MKELYSICWNITSNCNEHCNFCYRKKCKAISLEENKKIFDNLSQIKIGKITFSGGEPLLYNDLFKLVDYIRQQNSTIKLSLTTNGQLITNVILEEIIKKFDWVTFSVDSSSNEINDKIGRGEKHLSKIIELLEKSNGRIKIKINTVVGNHNINDLNNIYKIISNYKISRWKIFRFYPIRSAKKNKDYFFIDEVDSKKIEDIVNNFKTNKIKIHYNNFEEFTTSYFNIYPDGSIEDANGNVVGNLLNNSIFHILSLLQGDLQNHYLRNNYN